MDKYTILHYVEKTHYNGSVTEELINKRDPLQIKSDFSVVAIRFYDRNKPSGTFTEILRGKMGEPYNYSNYYYYGERKDLTSLENEYKLLENLRPGTNKPLKNIINKMILSNNDEVILDYRYSPFDPFEVFPDKEDMTITEYKESLEKQKVLKK